jgi:hypothetical protein
MKHHAYDRSRCRLVCVTSLIYPLSTPPSPRQANRCMPAICLPYRLYACTLRRYRIAANVWNNASWEALSEAMPTGADCCIGMGMDMGSFTDLFYPSTLSLLAIEVQEWRADTAARLSQFPALAQHWPSSHLSRLAPVTAEAQTAVQSPLPPLPATAAAAAASASVHGTAAALATPVAAVADVFGLDPHIVEGMIFEAYPHVPVISGVGPPNYTVAVMQVRPTDRPTTIALMQSCTPATSAICHLSTICMHACMHMYVLDGSLSNQSDSRRRCVLYDGFAWCVVHAV